MIAFDRDIMMFVAIVVCIAASGYIYRELMKTKEEMKSYRNFTAQVAHKFIRPAPSVASVTETEPEAEPETPEEPVKEPVTPRKPVRKVKFSTEE